MEAHRHEAADVQSFVVSYFERIGGIVDFTEYSLAEVVIPDEYAEHFDGRTFFRITFDQEVARENEDAEFITYGSHFLDKLTVLAMERGLAAARYIVVDRLEQGRVVEKLTNQFAFIRCKPALDSSTIRNFHYVLFNFKIVYLTDEREEVFQSVLVNLNTNRPADKLGRMINSVLVTDEREIICPEEKSYSIQAAYKTACEELKRRSKGEIEDKERENQRRLWQDLRRINQYHDDLREELEAQLRKAVDDPKRATSLEGKIKANDLERERREKELRDRYRLRVQVKLNNAVFYSQPKVVNFFTVSQRSMKAPLKVVWDPLLREFEPPICTTCGEELRRINLEKGGEITCWRSH